jgi:hypothetical protein
MDSLCYWRTHIFQDGYCTTNQHILTQHPEKKKPSCGFFIRRPITDVRSPGFLGRGQQRKWNQQKEKTSDLRRAGYNWLKYWLVVSNIFP